MFPKRTSDFLPLNLDFQNWKLLDCIIRKMYCPKLRQYNKHVQKQTTF